MAIWYAQLASTNIDAAGQWNDAPGGGGNVLTWSNLAVGDILCANGKASITINVSFECAAITTLGNYGGGIGADGGQFYVQTGAQTFTLTTDIVAGTSACLQTRHSSGTVAVIGDVTAGSAGTSAYGIHKYAGAGTLTVEGTVTGGTDRAAAFGINCLSGATVITGAVVGGTNTSNNNPCGVYVNGACTVTINGTVTGGSNTSTQYWCAGVWNHHASGVVTVNGTVTGGTGFAASGVVGALGPITVIGSLVDSATCSAAAAGKVYWQPASVAHYWQVAWNGSTNQRYTVPPVQGNVRNGVNYGYYGEALNDGTLVLPAITDVKLGVGYGEDGTEYEGQLVAGGGGVPLIGPGGLVG